MSHELDTRISHELDTSSTLPPHSELEHHLNRNICIYILIERNPPLRGGFLFTMFPHQEPCVRGPPSKHLVQILRGGSSYTRFLMREHSKEEAPPGGGVSFDQYVYTYIYIYTVRLSVLYFPLTRCMRASSEFPTHSEWVTNLTHEWVTNSTNLVHSPHTVNESVIWIPHPK